MAKHSAGKKTHICFGDVEPLQTANISLQSILGGAFTAQARANVLAVFWRNTTELFFFFIFFTIRAGKYKILGLRFLLKPLITPECLYFARSSVIPGVGREVERKKAKSVS